MTEAGEMHTGLKEVKDVKGHSLRNISCMRVDAAEQAARISDGEDVRPWDSVISDQGQ